MLSQKMLQRQPPNKPRRYCGIKTCVNFKGCSSSDHTFFRPPPDKYTHDKWKEAIGEHQNIRYISLICDLHFDPENIIHSELGKRRKLRTGSIPTIFASRPNACKTEPINSTGPIQNIRNLNNVKSLPNGANAMACRNCIGHQKEVQKLRDDVQRQKRLTEHWKKIAKKFEPTREDPKWSIHHVERVTTELLDVLPSSPPKEKILKPYQCGACNECFEQPLILERHLRLNHYGRLKQNLQKIQKCMVCRENIDMNQSGINRHVCMQRNVIECEFCEKEFISTTRLVRHLEKVHMDCKFHKCDRCEKKFRMKWLIDCHSLSHDIFDRHLGKITELKCAACLIEFSSTANLKYHQQLHCPLRNGAPSVALNLCELCGSDFQHIDDLKKHMVDVHDKQKFECSICFQLFATQFSLNRHRERHNDIPTTSTCDEMGKISTTKNFETENLANS